MHFFISSFIDICALYREGQPFQQSCGFGAVFDEILGCVHPDQTKWYRYSSLNTVIQTLVEVQTVGYSLTDY